MISYLRKQDRAFNRKIFSSSITSDIELNTIKYLHELNYPFNYYCISKAIQVNRLDILKFLVSKYFTHENPGAEYGVKKSCIVYAERHGFQDIVEYLESI
jgi:hypothetical protein